MKALTAFPSVLDNMAKNLSWTSSLGEAYHNQASDVMKAVQTLPRAGQGSGHAEILSQITVMQPSPGLIDITPTNPQVVYVPQYNPAVIYGEPYVWPGYRGRRGRRRRDWLRRGNRGRRVDGQRLGMEHMGL